MSNTRSFQSDYDFGIANEIEVLELLNKEFNTKLKRIEYQYSKLDYSNEDNTIYAELKSRRIDSTRFTTTLITTAKLDSIVEKEGVKYYICFKFTDGLFYVEYTKELFDTFKRTLFKRAWRTGKVDTAKEHFLVPIESLKKIETEEDKLTNLFKLNFVI